MLNIKTLFLCLLFLMACSLLDLPAYDQEIPDCEVLYCEGNDLYYSSQFREALVQWEAALACYREESNRQGEGKTLNNLGVACASLSQYKTAIEYYEQALSIAREIDDRRGEGNALGNLGIAYTDLGQYQAAIEYYEQALGIAREIGDRRGEAIRLAGLGLVYDKRGQYRTAIGYHKQALAIARAIGDRRGEGANLGNLGLAYGSLGQYQTAIEYHEQALSITREIGDRRGEGTHIGNLGIVYRYLGQYDVMFDYYKQALSIAQEIDDRQSESLWLNNLGGTYADLGQYQTAIECYEQALRIAREISDRRQEGHVLGNLGIAYRNLDQHQIAIEYLGQALSIAQETGDRRGEGISLDNLGLAYGRMGQYHTAIDYHDQALSIVREIGDRRTESISLNNIGWNYYIQGNWETAVIYFDESIAIRENLRAELQVDLWKTSFIALYIGPYQSNILALLHLNRSADAFAYVQRSKARTFLDQMGNPRVNPRATDDPALLEQEQALLDDIRGLEAVLYGRHGFATLDDSPPLTPEQHQEIQARQEATYREYDQLLAQIQRTNPQYAALRTVQASTLITVQQTLPSDVTLVEYYVVSPTQTLAFIVTREDFHTISISVTQDAVSAEMERFQVEAQTSLIGVPGSLQTLYEWLFAPLREIVTTPVLLLAPHQQLHYLPFAALHDGEHYLVEDYVILYTPSASVLEYLIQNAADVAEGGALILGNPANPEVSRLLGAEREAQAIADLLGARAFLGADATEARLWVSIYTRQCTSHLRLRCTTF